MEIKEKEVGIKIELGRSILDTSGLISSMGLTDTQRKNLSLQLKELTKQLDSGEQGIPISIFDNELSALESIVRYLKEKENFSFAEISRILNRSQRNIWLSYSRSKKKLKGEFKVPLSGYYFPAEIFYNLKFSILENLVSYLHNNFKLSFTKIARLIHRSPKTVWTTYSRYKNKSDG